MPQSFSILRFLQNQENERNIDHFSFYAISDQALIKRWRASFPKYGGKKLCKFVSFIAKDCFVVAKE